MADMTDPGVRPAAIVGVALALLAVLLAAVALAWIGWHLGQPNGPNAPPAIRVQAPVLEPAPQSDQKLVLRRQQDQREVWGWIAGEPGVARIPLSEAERLLIARDAARRRKEGR